MPHEMVTTRARPDLAEVTGLWRWEQFFAKRGRSLATVLEAERQAARVRSALPLILVSLVAGEPVGMAALAAQDLDERPDLGPWLAGVYVTPAFRGQGHATRLVGAVEHMARATAIPSLWLYTRTAGSLYGRCGWSVVARFAKNGQAYDLMKRELSGVQTSTDSLR